jgi:transcriptional regulator with XRE-family HTH domain
MSSKVLIDVLKRDLKARGITYRQLAEGIGVSEATVKRMFARKAFTLDRIDRICAFAGVEFAELTRGLDRDSRLLTQLSLAQEREIVHNKKLFLVAVSVLGQMAIEQIVAIYRITHAECVQMLVRLDRIGIIDLMPGNRIKLRVARTFAWLPDGPIQRLFRDESADYFASDFTDEAELLLFVNARLSKASIAALFARLRRVAREFSDQHAQDAWLPLPERLALSLLLAARPWELRFMTAMRRTPVESDEKKAPAGALSRKVSPVRRAP